MKIRFDKYYTPHASQGPWHASPAKYKLIGGAMGGGKSFSLCGEAVQLSIEVPGNRGVIVRKNLTVLKRTTLVTFFRVCPPELIENFNKSELKVTLINGSEILFLEADESKDPLFHKLRSLEIGWFAIDEASEVTHDAFKILCSRLRWPAARDRYFGLLGSNPEQCWVKDEFIDKQRTGFAFFQALPTDNPSLPPEYVPGLREIFDENQQRKYIDGDWNVTDDPMQIIPYTALKNCVARPEELDELTGREALGIDVAELGDDKTAFVYFRGPVCCEVEIFAKKRTDEVSDIARARIVERRIDANMVGVDAVGNGAGVWGNLYGAGLYVQRIIAGEAEIPNVFKQKFMNLKAQMWWALRLDVMNPDSGFRILDRRTLIQDLTATRYTVAKEKAIAVESKDSMRKRIGRSTDEGDACVMGNWVRTQRGLAEYRFGILGNPS
jgi:phage terminase large subunit